jgi:hypothetical protein
LFGLGIKLTEQKWTKTIKSILKKKGKRNGFDLNNSEKKIEIKKGLSVKPDVVWSKNGKFRYIFEIDTGARDIYPKTIYGSILSGIILAKFKEATLIEITPRSPNGKKAKLIVELLKEYFGHSLPVYVIEVGRISGKFQYENMHKSLTEDLRKIGIDPL